MIYFNISMKIAIGITVIAMISNVVLCFVQSNHNLINQLKSMVSQLRWIGTLYFGFSWFMGNGSKVASGRITYEQVAYWLLIASVGWLIIFVLTLISKAWNREDKLSSGALLCGISYFILAFLLH